MAATWDYVSRLARRSEEIGFDLTLVAELNLNDIKGIDAPSLDAWTTAAALAAVTERLEIMVAVRPTFHHSGAARQAGGEHRPHQQRAALAQRGVVVVGDGGEAVRRAVRPARRALRAHRGVARGASTGCGAGRASRTTARYYSVDETVLEPKPVRSPRPTIYAGGESPAAQGADLARRATRT